MKLIHAVIITLICTACSGYKYKSDNLVEEIVEEAVPIAGKVLLNVNIPQFDLSPGTPEEGFNPSGAAPFVKVDIVPPVTQIDGAPASAPAVEVTVTPKKKST